MHRLTLLVLAAAAAQCVAGPAPAQTWIELTRVPERISGSLEEGRNLIVTATVRGADVVDVWLAVDPDASQRAPLIRSGPELWQVNLATGRAAELLESHGEGTVAVHARTADGRTVSSVPIRFEVPRASRRETGRIAQVVAFDDRRRYRAGPDEELWLVPEKVDRIEVRLWSDDRDASIEAKAGDRTWRLRRDGDRSAELEVTEEVAEAWRRSEMLTLHLGADERMLLHAIPRALEPDQRLHFTVGQRETLELPGSGGLLEVSLRDITRGQVRVDVRTTDGGVVVPARSMREGDRLRFEHRGESYVIELDCLINYLIGDDYAEFEVWKPSVGQ